MQIKSTVAALALAGVATAQNATSICDKYTMALLKNNTADNQYTILKYIVNTAVIGNFTKPKIPGVTFPDMAVQGILNPNGTTSDGHKVNLVPYFNGGLASSNRNDKAVGVNFLDDGGAAPLMENNPANGTSSNQYRLLTHLYQFFGTLLQCSQQGMPGYDSYKGAPGMFAVHKYMALNSTQMQYFIEQVGASAASFGVSKEDVTAVGNALTMAFDYKCAPNVTLAPALGSQQQAICIADDCKTSPNATCSAYPAVMKPAVANMTLAMGEGNATAPMGTTESGSGSGSGTGSGSGSSTSAPASTSSAAAAHLVVGSGLAAGLGLFAFLL